MSGTTHSPVPRMAYSVREVAEMTSLSVQGVKQLVRSGELRSVLIGRRRLVPVEAVTELLDRKLAA